MTAIHDVGADLSSAPQPRPPSRAFTWGWRAVMIAFTRYQRRAADTLTE